MIDGIFNEDESKIQEDMQRSDESQKPLSSEVSQLGDDLNKNMSVNMARLIATKTRISDNAIDGDKIDYSTVNHNALLNYEAKQHIDWTAASIWTIHPTNYDESDPVWASEKNSYALKTDLNDYVSRSGDTMTGDYEIDGYIQATDYRSGLGNTGITQDIEVVIDVRENAGQLEKITKELSFENGLLVHEGTASAWTTTDDI